MFTDFVLNGEAHGEVAQTLNGVRWDSGLLRPYFDGKHKCVTINTGRTQYNKTTGKDDPVYEQVRIQDLRDNGIDSPVFNATSLRKNDWIQIGTSVTRVARQRLRAWSDLAQSSQVGGFDAMSKLTYEYES